MSCLRTSISRRPTILPTTIRLKPTTLWYAVSGVGRTFDVFESTFTTLLFVTRKQSSSDVEKGGERSSSVDDQQQSQQTSFSKVQFVCSCVCAFVCLCATSIRKCVRCFFATVEKWFHYNEAEENAIDCVCDHRTQRRTRSRKRSVVEFNSNVVTLCFVSISM